MNKVVLCCAMCLFAIDALAQADEQARAAYAAARRAFQNDERAEASRHLADAKRLVGGDNAMTLALAVRLHYAEGNHKAAQEALSEFFERRPHPALVKDMVVYARKLDEWQGNQILAPLRKRIAYHVRLLNGYRQEQAAFQRARDAERPAALRAYLRVYPSGRFSREAKARLIDMEEESYTSVMSQTHLPLYRQFFEDYPESAYAPAALERYRRLRRIAGRINELEHAYSSYETFQIYALIGGPMTLTYGLMGVAMGEDYVIVSPSTAFIAGLGITGLGYWIYNKRRGMKRQVADLKRTRTQVVAALIPTYDFGQQAPGLALSIHF